MADRQLQAIELSRSGRIATIKLNRPTKLNAINEVMKEEVKQALNELAEDDEIRSVVLAGNGRAFSAGYDLAGESHHEVEPTRAVLQSSDVFALAVWRFPKPLVAAVHGFCLAGACEIAMLCDVTIASESCQLGEPEIRFGSGSTLVMPWLVPMKAAKELLLGGSLISAQRAYELGIVNRVVEDDRLMAEAERVAGLFAAVAPAAARLTKRGINAAYERAGMWQSIDHHTELLTHMHLIDSEEKNTFTEISERDGVRAALTWRDAQFRQFDD
jgi:enoyl-CoA hydratase